MKEKNKKLNKIGNCLFLSAKFCLFFSLMAAAVSKAENSLQDLEPSPKDNSSAKEVQIKSISDLQQITPYTSISVIQKRYLPKTFRGEFNFSFSGTINHTFFYLGGVSGRLGFFIREDHGLGVEGFATLPPIFKIVTRNITGPPNHILPSTTILPQFYGGVYYKWSPIFGKFTLLDRKILYFDTYTTIGGGMHKVLNGQETIKAKAAQRGLSKVTNKESEKLVSDVCPALSLGLGQLFALNQTWAVNWELKWFYTFARIENNKEGRLYTPTDINLSIGVNYYFPEAGYR